MLSARLSIPNLATGQCHWRALNTRGFVHSGLSYYQDSPLQFSSAHGLNRDRTVSRRSKPSSRTTLNGEQLVHAGWLWPQDVMSRHPVPKHRRRYELLGGIQPVIPVPFIRWAMAFHSEPRDHYDLLSHLLELSFSQSSGLMPLH